MKCQWKVLKLFATWRCDATYAFNSEAFLEEFYIFMKCHPFSSFSAQDITPLKTMKTIIHSVVMHLGPAHVKESLSRLPEIRNSEAGMYLNKLVTRELAKNPQSQPIPPSVRPPTTVNTPHQNANNNLQRKFMTYMIAIKLIMGAFLILAHSMSLFHCTEFFSALPDPNSSKTRDERASMYMDRLKEIQKRGGLGSSGSSNNN